jgi:hypothetical protein
VRKFCPFFVTLFTLGIAGPASAQATIPADELVDRLARAESLAEEGLSDPSTERMLRVRRTIGLPVVIELRGWTVSVAPDPVLERLEGGVAGDFERAIARLRALRGAVEAALAADPADPERVEAALDAAYSSAIQVRPGLVERIRRAMSELTQALAVRLLTFVGTSTLLAWAVLIALGVGAFWLLRRLRFVPERRLPGARVSTRAELVDWSRRAEEAIRAGDLNEAIRALYRSLLATLVRRGLLVEGPGLTAGECRAAVGAARPALFAAVAQATDSFERVAYGGASPGPNDVEVLQSAEALARAA